MYTRPYSRRAAREQTISYSPKSVEEQVADLLVAVAVVAVWVIVGGCMVICVHRFMSVCVCVGMDIWVHVCMGVYVWGAWVYLCDEGLCMLLG